MKHWFICLSIFTSFSILQAQERADRITETLTSSQVEKLLSDAFLNRVEIEASSIRAAVQQLCDLLVDKQSTQNENKIIFSVNVPPTSGKNVTFQAKFKDGLKVMQLFCDENDLIFSIHEGIIQLDANTQSEKYKKTVESMKQIAVPDVKITAEYLPQALRNLLSPHQLSFTIHSHKKRKDGSSRPLLLEQVRISDYRKQNTNLFAVLNELATLTKMRAWITPQGITFTHNTAQFNKIIKASKFAK